MSECLDTPDRRGCFSEDLGKQKTSPTCALGQSQRLGGKTVGRKFVHIKRTRDMVMAKLTNHTRLLFVSSRMDVSRQTPARFLSWLPWVSTKRAWQRTSVSNLHGMHFQSFVVLTGVLSFIVNGKPVTAHIYEYTTQISITPELKQQGAERGIVPVQIIFCLKEKNQKKINSCVMLSFHSVCCC
jgi:hypothetical protein